MTTVKARAPQRKRAAALLQSKPPKKVAKPAAYFHESEFAYETDRRLCKRVNDYGRRLGRLEHPKPGQLEHYWTHQGEMIATIGS